MSSNLHPDGKLKPIDSVSNDSSNTSITELIEQRLVSRRGFLKSTVGATAGVTAASVLGTAVVDGLTNHASAAPAPLGTIGFTSVPANLYLSAADDAVTVPAGYTARTLIAWGDSLTNAPSWNPSGAMDEATQLHCYGAHTDGMHFFPFPSFGASGQSSARGLLVSNSEYCDPALVNNISPASDYASVTMTLAMVRAQQAAHGINVVEVQSKKGSWEVKRPSGFNRRITVNTPCEISGPAAGHALMKTAADTTGMKVLGTLNNCANGYTPWDTYLTCEENWNGNFGANGAFTASAHEARYGVSAGGFGYRWHEADPRFDVNANRNEPNRFGWIVEIDPFNPRSTPVKRTAMGRFKHESAMVVVDGENNVAFYMGDDERNEYVYKFVCARKYNPKNRAANRDMLDHGTLYVARFNEDGSGQWLPLVHGQNGLTAANGFASQAEVLIKTRQAADFVGATMMDRPEWTAAHPVTGEVYLTLTNNNRRGGLPASSNKADGTTGAGSARPPVDAANPRPDNDYGHIIRWRDAGQDVTATAFEWDIFVQCGDKLTSKTLSSSYTAGEFGGQSVGYEGNINGDDYGAPDGLWFDREGRLWIQTDQAGNATGDWANIGGNVMMCADPSTGVTKRFLTAPKNSEVTGIAGTPDGKTLFVGLQHPGEDWSASFTDNSTWPDSGANGPTTASGLGQVFKPRSGIVVITKDDGGVIGS
jgi:secreted PhoX family phosphatase